MYTPYQFDATATIPAIMVFQDGGWYHDPHGSVRATKVFDSLIHTGEMPATIGVFLMPDRPIEFDPQSPLSEADQAIRQRSIEYDKGGHSLHHGGAIFADSLRWLWRE